MDFEFITIHVFLEMLVEWIVEFYIISTLMFFRCGKRKLFILRYILGLLVVVGISYPLSILFYSFGETVIGRSLIYLLLFGMAIGHHLFCYKEDFLRTLLFSDIAYLTQNCIYKIFLILHSILQFFGAYGPYGPTLAGYKTIYYCSFVVLTAICYFAYICRIKKYFVKLMLPNLTILISLFTIFISIFICSTLDIYLEKVFIGVNPIGDVNILFINGASDMLAVLLDTSIIIMFFAYMRRIRMSENIARMEYIIAQSEEQYKISQETIESINIKCHDMRHKVNQIVGDNLSKETLEEVNEVITVYDSLIDTGNKTLDVILSEKSLICDINHITFTRLIEGKAVNFLSSGDLFCLFGNILDNAIEATKNLKDQSKKYINLKVKKMGKGIVKIECDNYFESPIEFENNLPKTLKDDKNLHGFGMKSIKNIVDKYGGSMSIKTKGNVFKLNIVLYDNLPIK